MEEDSTNEVAAELSIRNTGVVYIGREARNKLNAEYNDKVKVEIPALNRVVEGAIDSAGHIRVGKDVTDPAFADTESVTGATQHIDGIVRRLTGTWDDDHGLTEERHEKVDHLDSKTL